MAYSVVKFSTDASVIKRNVILETPEKEDLQTYSQTPVSSVRRPKTSSENKQKSASGQVKDSSSYSAESRVKIYQKCNLDKIRVFLFHDMEKKDNTKAPMFPVNPTLFYGNNASRFLPLAPNILGIMNKKIDQGKSISPSLYDFPNNKRSTRKRKSGGVNSGIGHGIKKLKSKVNSIKHESTEINEETVTEKQCQTLQKENVGKVENSQSMIPDYDPNKKFFKHKRPELLEITLGKPKPKKNVKQEENKRHYSNVFDTLKSKKQYHKPLNNRPQTHSNSEAQRLLPHSPAMIKKEIPDQNQQYQQNSQKLLPAERNSIGYRSSNPEESNNLEIETENEVNDNTDPELPYQNLAMDIKNNNFSSNEMMTDIAVQECTRDDSMEITIGTDSIINVKPFGPKSHREKAFEVLKFIKTELDLSDDDLVDNQKKHFFMYTRERSIVGILVAEYLDFAFKLDSNASVPCRMFSESFPVKCGINIIWVSTNHRRQGIATKMMELLQDCFCSNYRMDINDVAFSIPTTNGRYFVEKYVGSCDFKVF